MPFTPFHLGAGLLIKSAKPASVSFLMFAGSQVAMDIEPLVRILRGDIDVHGFSHTLLGATLILALCMPFRWLVNRFFATSWRAAFWGAMTGVYSHLLLDGFLHRDMDYFWRGWLAWSTVEQLCLVMGAVGSLVLIGRGTVKAAWRELMGKYK